MSYTLLLPTQLTQMLTTAAVLSLLCTAGYAQFPVESEDYESYYLFRGRVNLERKSTFALPDAKNLYLETDYWR